MARGTTLCYDGHDGRENVFNRIKHLRPQQHSLVWLHVLMLERQSQKHLRPDVAGSRPTHTTTCGQYYMGRDRQQTHLQYDVLCSVRVFTNAPAVRSVLPKKHLRSQSYLLPKVSASDNRIHRLIPHPDGVTLHFNEYWSECHDGDLSTGGSRAIGQTHETCHPPQKATGWI
jgi:hypothetical protein